MDTQKFIPFHAINQFMVNDYRQMVIRQVMAGIDQLPGSRKAEISKLFKRHVSIPGFRNSMAAPLSLKVKTAVTTFERRPDFTAQVLAGWSDLNTDLRQKVHTILQTRNWETLLPPDADRAQMPGFMIDWPKNENYDTLEKAFAETYPDDKPAENDLRLMFVWIGGRLPYGMDEEEKTEE